MSLLDYAVTQAQAAIDRVLEKAGARIRGKAQGTEFARLVNGIDSRQVVPVLAAAGTDVEPLVAAAISRSDFKAVVDRIMARVRRTQESAAKVLEKLTGIKLTDGERATLDGDRTDGEQLLLDALLGAASAALYRPDGTPARVVRGESLDTRVPTHKIRDALAAAGGAAAETATRNIGAASVSPGLVANGRRMAEFGEKRGVTSLAFVWRYGDPASRVNNFEPHQHLNGVEFVDYDDPVLSTEGTGAGWVGAFFRPGDHKGCLCMATRVVKVKVPGAGVQTGPPYRMPPPPTVCPSHAGLSVTAHALVADADCRTSSPSRRIVAEHGDHSSREYAEWRDRQRDLEWEATVTPDEIEAMRRYAGSEEYIGINRALRENPDLPFAGYTADDEYLQAALRGHVHELDAKTAAQTLLDLDAVTARTYMQKAERTVYRSVRRGDMEGILRQYADANHALILDGFTSTTLDPASLYNVESVLGLTWRNQSPIVLEMRTRSGALIDDIIDNIDRESEWLLPHQTAWIVEEVEDAVEFVVGDESFVRTVVRMRETDSWE